ncbi:MAG TPA: helix-turn-helix domain-containing protein [Anaerolineales bacterium]|nr:helix-turn-helix domain-containing protein [Anaerolineales bacterium]
MSLISEQRLSDSPYIESVTRGWTIKEGTTIRPAEIHWHMVFVKHSGGTLPLVVGPLTFSGTASWGEGGEILWIKFKLGVFMPHLPTKYYLDGEQTLPDASSERFWWKGAARQFPNFENVEAFIERLVREDDLVRDPVVDAALQDQQVEMSARTVRHRFLQATGQTQSHIRQYERAIKAASLLRHGVSILDTVFEAGYFDQPHLTRSLKQFVGHTPAQIIRGSQS